MVELNLFELLADLPGDHQAMLAHNLWSAWYEASDAPSVLRVVRLRYLRVAHLAHSTPRDIEVAARVLSVLSSHEAAALAAIMVFRGSAAEDDGPDD